jgi:hypothetical protein
METPNDAPLGQERADKKWAEMNAGQKIVFVLKVIIMVCTGGFVFGNVL